MRIILKCNLFVFVFFVTHLSIAQKSIIDSLNTILKTTKNDTVKLGLFIQMSEACDEKDIFKYASPAVELADILLNQNKNNTIVYKNRIQDQKAIALNNIGYFYNTQNNAGKAIEYLQKSIIVHEETGNKKEIGNLLNNIGRIYDQQGAIQKALDFYTKGLKIREEIKDKKDIANSLNNIGLLYENQGNIPKALEYWSKSLQFQEEVNDKQGMAISLSSIAFIFHQQGDVAKALEYWNRSLRLNEMINNKLGTSMVLNNIAGVLYKQGNINNALDYFNRSLKIREETGDKHEIASSFSNLATVYGALGDISKSVEYCNKSLEMMKEIGDKKGISHSLNSIGALHLKMALSSKNLTEKQKKLTLALSYCDSSLGISKDLGFPENISNAEENLYNIYSEKGNYYAAFEHYKQFIIYRDSTKNESTRKASIKNQLKYEFEKKEAVLKEQQEKERIVTEEKDRFQQIVIWSVIIGLVLVASFAAFIFRSLKVTKQQKHVIEEKQKEILDSIRYAKRIQKSLLPTEKYIERSLKK